MLRLQSGQRTFVAEGLRDAANVAAGALVFGQFLGDAAFSVLTASFGAAVWMALVLFATTLIGRSDA
jgi:hypothetical protein